VSRSGPAAWRSSRGQPFELFWTAAAAIAVQSVTDAQF
jgi:hypothetical protein